ncbi:MAG: DUF4864 protein [Candidatus Magasanikbacteria bacterium]|nr:DUF4864 protein [Candidatus Magasanikbacteria bacterium]
MSKLVKILIGLAAAVGLIVGVAFWATGGIKEVALKQLAAISAGDYETAYALNAVDLRRVVTRDDFKKYLDDHPALKNNKSASFSSRSVQNNVGRMSGTLIATDGGKAKVEYWLIKEAGTWTVLDIKIGDGQGAAELSSY